MTTLKEDQTETLARAFSLVLRKWLSERRIRIIILRNQTTQYKDCCASHDFCDANMVMDDAWHKVFKRKYRFYSDEDTNLLNAAWDLAKNNEFYVDTKNK